METEGKVIEVLRSSMHKKRLLDAGDSRHNAIRLGLLGLSGTLRGAYGGGQAIALRAACLHYVFDWVFGSSTSAPGVAYLTGGNPVEGASVYTNECTTPAFISIKRALLRLSIAELVDLDFVTDVFRGYVSKKAIDQDAVRASRTEIYAAVTDIVTGRGAFLDMKTTKPDMIEAIRASIAIPGISRSIRIEGRDYCDGSVGFPLPVREIIERFAPTDLLILANRSRDYAEKGMLRRLVEDRAMRLATPALQEAIRTRQARFEEELRWLRNQNQCRYAIIWSDKDIGGFTRDPVRLTAAVERSRAHMRHLLLDAQV